VVESNHVGFLRRQFVPLTAEHEDEVVERANGAMKSIEIHNYRLFVPNAFGSETKFGLNLISSIYILST